MATSAMPQPDQQGGSPKRVDSPPQPQGGDQGQQGPPSQGPANQLQQLLARWSQTAKQMGASDPRLAEGAELVNQGIQKMQTALVTPPQPTPVSQQPTY